MLLSRFFGRTKELRKQNNRRMLKSRLRRLHLESLEPRVVFASDYENVFIGKDVNDDGFITPVDALVTINKLFRTSGPLPPIGSGQVPPAYYDVNGDGEITALDPLLVLNHLSRSTPASVDEQYVSPVNLQTTRTAAESDKPTIVKFSMTPNNFNISGSEALVRFIVSPADASQFDPGAIVVKKSDGSVVASVISSNDTPFSKASFTIVSLAMGEYTLEISGEDGTTGAFNLSTSLVGDANNDGTVNDLDRKAIGTFVQNRSYGIGGDADLDGLITGEDYNWGRSKQRRWNFVDCDTTENRCVAGRLSESGSENIADCSDYQFTVDQRRF